MRPSVSIDAPACCQGQSTAIRTLVMHTMAEWYMRGEHHDQARLSRILDVAQDLKVTTSLSDLTDSLTHDLTHDRARLSRILDVAQDLKVTTSLSDLTDSLTHDLTHDRARLSRILDVAQDLKVTTSLSDLTHCLTHDLTTTRPGCHASSMSLRTSR